SRSVILIGMVSFDYLSAGLYGLAHAHRAGTMAGHLGAAVTAGYFLGEDLADLPEEVYRGVEGELDRIIAGEEAIWFNAKKAGVTPTELFAQLPDEDPTPDRIPEIVDALQQNVGACRQSGHNIIFASIAVRALHDHPEYATPQVIKGVTRLTLGFNNAHAGRGYYGKETGWKSGNEVQLSPDDSFPSYASIPHMVAVTIDELIVTASVKKQGFGGLWHIINHAAAIAELDRLGFADVAHAALPAHHQHIQYWRTLPDVESELGAVVKAADDPRESTYWEGMLKRDEARLTHRIKTLYGFFTILRHVTDDVRRVRALDAFRYLMA
ncbi:MAG: hypothetical protein KDA75_18960, partial [Planctomycetaceae bacterium]|nr:hypothetical protein [Planctomycetaceae bacterium]